MSRIQSRCKELSSRGEGLLIGYLMVGDPDLARSREYARALISGGMDLLALGVPFSDPMAEEPALRAAGRRALAAGTTPPRVFDWVRELRQETSVPLVLMTYYNPMCALGEEAFLKRSLEAGIDGMIVCDLPLEEAASVLAPARRYRLDTIFWVTPETTEDRLRAITHETRGFVCVTAIREPDGLRRLRALAPAELPIAVRVEASRAAPAPIREMLRVGAQGAFVDSALVERMAAGISPEQLRGFVEELKRSTRPLIPLPAPAPPTPEELTPGWSRSS
jgi:tryptophan synthase alpha chain